MKKSGIVLAMAVLMFSSVAIAKKKAEPTVPVTPYPLKTCLITGNDLGSMGDPIVRVYNGIEVKFCCKPCVEEFDAKKEFYLTKLKQSTASDTVPPAISPK